MKARWSSCFLRALWCAAVSWPLLPALVTMSVAADVTFPGPTPPNWRLAAEAILTDSAGPVPAAGPWWGVGPFSPQDFPAPYPPEAEVAESAEGRSYLSATGRRLSWREVEIPEGKDFDLRGLCPDQQGDGTFYLSRALTAERSCVQALALRGMSGLAVWIDGRLLVDRGPGDGWLGGGWQPREALLVPLAKGRNRLLVKVDGLHKRDSWIFRHGRPEPDELRYTLSMTLRYGYAERAAELDWLRRDRLDLLKLWPAEARDADFNQRLREAAGDALRRGAAWLALLGAAGAPESGLEELEPELELKLEELAGALRRIEGTLADPAGPLVESYLDANAACRRLESLPRAQTIQNWLELDQRSVLSPLDPTLKPSIAAALKRGERLLDDYGSRLAAARDTDGWHRRLGSLQSRLEASSPETSADAWRQLYVDAHQAVRELVFENPLLSFSKLLFYTRYSPRTMNIHRHQLPSARYMDWPAQPGGDLYVLSGLRPDGRPEPLLRGRLGKGVLRGHDLSHDGRRVVFGFWNADIKRPRPERRFEYDCYVTEGHTHLHELDLSTGSLRQLTDEPWHDIDPSYLPGGRIAFASERCGHNAQCDPDPWSEPMVNLYSIGAGGGDVRRLTSHKDSDTFPRVLNDGRLFYTRWEYHERGGLLHTQNLWVSRPDGTQQDALYKAHMDYPFSLEEGRAVPGSSKIVAVATGHHTNPAGAIVRIDLSRGISDAAAMEVVTPGFSVFEGGLNAAPVPEGGVAGYGYYTTPWPLSEKYFLVSYNPGSDAAPIKSAEEGIPWGHYLVGVPDVDMTRAAGYGLYVIDVHGNRELIYRDPDISCFSPVPMEPRPTPPVLLDSTDPGDRHATLVVTDVGQGLDVPAGTVRHIRISEAMPWPYTKEGASRYPRELDYTMKRTLGIVPVEADGSAHFTVPAGVGLYFQALDESFIEVRRMRSLVSFQPGERRSCTGCHETQPASPPPAGLVATLRGPSAPEPPPWGSDRPISFLRDVQPVLDKRCVSCHSGLKPAGNVDLFPGLTGPAHDRAHSTSFDALSKYVPRSHVPFDAGPGRVKFDVSQPYQFGSGKSELVRLLKEGHEGVKLERDEWLAVLTWIDSNGLYLGSFVSVHDWGRWGYRPGPADMQAVRVLEDRRCGACHQGANLARPGWIDPRDPRDSLHLLAPLAKAAGGWGKCQPGVFQDASDPDYKALLKETRRIWDRMSRDPTPELKELIAAASRKAARE